jgi:hypothetical protein
MVEGSPVRRRWLGWAVLVMATALAAGMLTGRALTWRTTHAAFNGAAGAPGRLVACP